MLVSCSFSKFKNQRSSNFWLFEDLLEVEKHQFVEENGHPRLRGHSFSTPKMIWRVYHVASSLSSYYIYIYIDLQAMRLLIHFAWLSFSFTALRCTQSPSVA